METGLENDLLGDAFAEGQSEFPGLGSLGLADVRAAYPELDFLSTPAYEWTADQRQAYNFALSYLETGDWYARSFDGNNEFDPTKDYSSAFDILDMDQPEFGPESVIERYETVNGEGSFGELSWSEQRDIMGDSNVGWSRTDHHEYNDTLGGYDREGFTGYDEDATYSYAYGLEADGNSGYQNLRPWDVEAKEMTVGELREIYASDGNLQATFGSEEDFLNYVAEMNYAGFGDIYGEDGSLAASQDYSQNPIATDIFERYATGSGDLQVSYDPVHGYVATNAMGDTFKWTGSQWMPEQIAYRPSTLGSYVKMAVSAGLGLATGNAAGILGAAGGLGGTVSGALSGALGSAVGQVAAGGKIDAGSLLQAAILGAIGGFADSLQNMDSAIADGGILGTADDIVNATSELLGVGYDEALAILEGVATGAVSGGDLESIVAGAAGSWSSAKMKDFLQGFYGDTIQVDDWFKDGASNIPVEALDPFIDQIVGGIIDGSIDDPGAWAKTIWDYFQAGGDVDFMLPDGVDVGDFFGGLSGSFDFLQCSDLEDIEGGRPWFCDMGDYFDGIGDILPDGEILCLNSGGEWDSSIGECIKSWLPDGSFEIGEPCTDDEGNPGWLSPTGLCNIEFVDILPEGTDCEEGFAFDSLLGQCVEIDIVAPELCDEGWTWDNLIGACVEDILPGGTDCEEGFAFDSLLGQCVEIDIPAPEICDEGWTWDNLIGECVEIGSTDCDEGFHWDSLLGQCVEIDAIECMEGWEWSDLYGQCVEKINDDIDCESFGLTKDPETGQCINIEGPEIDCESFGLTKDPETGQCINLSNPCEEQGGFLNEMGLCEFPDIDIGLPSFDTMDVDLTLTNPFEYTPYDSPELPGVRQLIKARGLLS